MKIKLKNIEFSYPKIPVLKDISLKLNEGEILAVTGKNGAGKSTLLKCISRVLDSYSGQIYIDEINTKKMNRTELAKQVAYLSQKIPETFSATVFDTVLMGNYPHDKNYANEENRDKTSEILEMTNLSHLALRNFMNLSGGQQQRVLIARAIAQNSDILLFDEPTSALDIKSQLEIMELIKKLVKERKISAVVSMHDLNLASRYSDSIIMLNDGLISAAGTPDEVFSPENIATAYDVEVEIKKNDDFHYIIPIKPIVV